MRRIVVWQPWDEFGAEFLEVSADASGARGVGTLIRKEPSGPLCVQYDVRCDASWRTVAAEVKLPGLESRAISVDLGGCLDVDIAACAFTNTLPIRRLALQVGQSAVIQAAYVHIPDLRVERVAQRYTHLAKQRYRYEGLSTGFVAEITVDADGLVIDYPQLCRRVLSYPPPRK
jgi:hypothetical protein